MVWIKIGIILCILTLIYSRFLNYKDNKDS